MIEYRRSDNAGHWECSRLSAGNGNRNSVINIQLQSDDLLCLCLCLCHYCPSVESHLLIRLWFDRLQFIGHVGFLGQTSYPILDCELCYEDLIDWYDISVYSRYQSNGLTPIWQALRPIPSQYLIYCLKTTMNFGSESTTRLEAVITVIAFPLAHRWKVCIDGRDALVWVSIPWFDPFVSHCLPIRSVISKTLLIFVSAKSLIVL